MPKTSKAKVIDNSIKTKMRKTELFETLSQISDFDTYTVKRVMASLEEVIQRSLSPNGIGEFTLPGIVVLRSIHKKARKAGTPVRNPRTGEMMKGKAKPASFKVAARALAKSKEYAIG